MDYTNKNIYNPATVDEDYFLEHEDEGNAFYMGIKKMPDIIIDTLFDDNAPNVMRGICQSFQLNARQSEELSRLVRQIMSAEVYLGDITRNIGERLNVNEVTAKEIASSVIAQFFGPALEELKKVHIEKFGPPSRKATEDYTKQEADINPNNTVNLRQ